MSKFKAGDKVRCVTASRVDLTRGHTYEIISVCDNWCRVINDFNETDGYVAGLFELLDKSSILTPEEVFEHIHKGTKLQIFGTYNTRTSFIEKWLDAPPVDLITYNTIVTRQWRIKPEPEIIELNGKKYREIVE